MEYIRSYRSLKLLSEELAERGFHVLRFDYFGTGDSWGSELDVTIDGRIEDVVMAAEELRSTSGGGPIHVVGLRLGAHIAAEAVPRIEPVTRLVLWEPVVPGGRSDRSAGRPAGVSFAHHIQGMHGQTSGEGVDQLPSIRDGEQERRRLVVFNSQSSAASLGPINDLQTSVEVVEELRCWVEERDFGAGAVPVASVRRIAEWLR
jgi:uncharacterized protein